MSGKHTAESIAKMKLAHAGTCQGENNPFYGRHHTEDSLAKMRQKLAGRVLTEEHKRRIGESGKGKVLSLETRKKIGISNTGKKRSGITKQHLSESHIGYKYTAEQLEKSRETHSRLWRVMPIERQRERVRATLLRTHMRPNNAEYLLLLILRECVSGDWLYTGSGSFMVGRYNPDYWDGKNKVIELWGEHWHKNQKPEDRVNLLHKYGYKALVVWYNDLYRNQGEVVNRLVAFNGAV